MSGPQMGLSSIADSMDSQIVEISALVGRMRSASRRLTGSTGEQPTKLEAVRDQTPPEIKAPPTLVTLTNNAERLNSIVNELRAEVVYFEGIAEVPMVEPGAETAGKDYR